MIVKIFDKSTGLIAEKPLDSLKLTATGLVELPVDPDEIASLSQEGNDLVIVLKTGQIFTLFGFYHEDSDGDHSELTVTGGSEPLFLAASGG
ncbi:BapA prefix-like domain-containing protein [Microbulbifer sp. MLAF003]|nr:BapA prefix-like domain-containing protein [Microbulbifer sp. MLAF003]WHI52378.1 BapA prefix-like domain-containing protein [Microbulbifer sp. MLAF003]